MTSTKSAEPLQSSLDGRLHRGRVGDVEPDREEVVASAKGLGDRVGAASGGDHGIARRERRLGDVDAHATGRTGDEPYLLSRSCRPLR